MAEYIDIEMRLPLKAGSTYPITNKAIDIMGMVSEVEAYPSVDQLKVFNPLTNTYDIPEVPDVMKVMGIPLMPSRVKGGPVDTSGYGGYYSKRDFPILRGVPNGTFTIHVKDGEGLDSIIVKVRRYNDTLADRWRDKLILGHRDTMVGFGYRDGWVCIVV